MNELKKTGIFWAVTAVMLLIATIIAWPTADDTSSDNLSGLIGEPLIPTFKDPLAVASMKIVNFDETEGTLSNFEVAKDSETGDWTIVSRKGYPADAVAQVTNAANSLISLKVLDVRPCTREDHDDLGVVEPKLEELNVGDEGVGRLVTFRDAAKKVVASLIIGDKVKDSDTQINVRIPGQDPVYVVALDDAPLTTNFQDWIEEDLLKLSSIDIDEMEVKDYSASLGAGGQISLERNYTASFAKDGSQWTLAKLQEFDPKRPTAQPKTIEVTADQELNTTKLNEIQNALDDLKIVNVLRKPDGMSANLRASEDFLSDEKAVSSLAQRGFYPVKLSQDGDTEILSANGETTVGLKDGVQYVLRFGNIAGFSEDDNQDDDTSEAGEKKKSATGANRYLLLTTRVDESKFPAPDLQEVPQTLEDLQKLDDAEAAKNALPIEPEPGVDDVPKGAIQENDAPNSADTDSDEEMTSDDVTEASEEKASDKPDAATDETESEAAKKEDASEEKADDKIAEEKPATDESTEAADTKDEPTAEEPAAEEPAAGEPKDETEGESETEGSESATATGQALQEVADDKDTDETKSDDETDTKDEATEEKTDAADDKASEPADEAAEEEKMNEADQAASEAKPAEETPADAPEETQEEKMERLEAMQEKITKENQRKIDERKDKLAKARNRVRELNARFADWYYVIPEETYTKLTIKRSELFQKEGEAAAAPNAGGPSFQMPGGIPNFGAGPGN